MSPIRVAGTREAASGPRTRRARAVSSTGRRAAVSEGTQVAAMQRRRLLHAFCEIAGESGLESAGIGHICKRAGVSRRTFYDLFEDREACFAAALDGVLEQLADRMSDAYASDAAWEIRLLEATGALLTLFDRDRATARMCVVETLKGDARVLDRRAAALATLAAAVDEGREIATPRSESEPSSLTAESVVGGALSVIHTRLLDHADPPLAPLTAPLAEMIVRQYLGARVGVSTTKKASSAKLGRTEARQPPRDRRARPVSSPFDGLPIRFTYRTALVIATIADSPGASSRLVGERAGIADQGQTSKLLRRLHRHGLIEHQSEGRANGEAYAWALTDRGRTVHQALAT
ncbi:MAG TPA: TetR family transcriptional regulator [Solirubrobacteraceae bacterium]|nr:TetR family transcriptional regulator [Solirubrobacteraceae bacterium]